MIDLNRNKITYIFPLMNYITRQQLIEISEEELHNIKSSEISKNNQEIVTKGNSLGIGLGFMISVSMRPIIKYMSLEVNFWLNISFVLMVIIPLLIIKVIDDKKKRQKLSISLNESRIKAFILPNNKYLLKNIFLNVFLCIMFPLFTLNPILNRKFSIISLIFIAFLFSIILFQNAMLYKQTKIEGRIGGIKWKK
nr:DUF443 family protein [Staphylococcus pettenkoferi]